MVDNQSIHWANSGANARVRLEHRNLHRHGDSWPVRDGIAGDDGRPLDVLRIAGLFSWGVDGRRATSMIGVDPSAFPEWQQRVVSGQMGGATTRVETDPVTVSVTVEPLADGSRSKVRIWASCSA